LGIDEEGGVELMDDTTGRHVGEEGEAVVLTAVRTYIREGYAPIPVHPPSPGQSGSGKNPVNKEWNQLRITEGNMDKYFTGSENVGILLGEASGNLVDVDLDCAEAIVAAPYILPTTNMVSGRAGAPESHWWYKSTHAQTRQFQDPDGGMLVEIRSTGSQTVVPPSIHPSGEELEWYQSGEPAEVEFSELLKRVKQLATVVLIARRWGEGRRHSMALALAGWFCRKRFSLEMTKGLISQICRASNDNEVGDRLQAVEDTYAKLEKGIPVTGLPALSLHLGENVTRKIGEWLGLEVTLSLRELEPKITVILGKRPGRAQTKQASELIVGYFLDNGCLLKDIQNPDSPQMYLKTKDGIVVPLDKENIRVKQMLRDVGINASEAAYKWIAEDFGTACLTQGRAVKVVRWSTCQNEKIYISSGIKHMVVCEMDRNLHVEDNGYDGILFSADACFADWEPVEQTESLSPLELQAFNPPALTAPPEASDYTPDVQKTLVEDFMIGLLLQVKEMPILTNIGPKESGKSTLHLAILQLFLGESGSLSTCPTDRKDFDTGMINFPVYAIDNLDSQPERWLEDRLATASTGGGTKERKLYSNSGVVEKTYEAKVMINTRTGVFASRRRDLVDRLLPVFFATLEHDRQESKDVIMREILDNRDRLLSYLAIGAIESLKTRKDIDIKQLSTRFKEFGAIVFRHKDEQGINALKAWWKAQQIAVIDPDPLLQGILTHFQDSSSQSIKGNAANIKSTLRCSTQIAIPEERGKAGANSLRELKGTLAQHGIILSENNRKDYNGQIKETIFTLQKSGAKGESGGSVKVPKIKKRNRFKSTPKSLETPRKKLATGENIICNYVRFDK
jgi:hypothetical protein